MDLNLLIQLPISLDNDVGYKYGTILFLSVTAMLGSLACEVLVRH